MVQPHVPELVGDGGVQTDRTLGRERVEHDEPPRRPHPDHERVLPARALHDLADADTVELDAGSADQAPESCGRRRIVDLVRGRSDEQRRDEDGDGEPHERPDHLAVPEQHHVPDLLHPGRSREDQQQPPHERPHRQLMPALRQALRSLVARAGERDRDRQRPADREAHRRDVPHRPGARARGRHGSRQTGHVHTHERRRIERLAPDEASIPATRERGGPRALAFGELADRVGHQPVEASASTSGRYRRAPHASRSDRARSSEGADPGPRAARHERARCERAPAARGSRVARACPPPPAGRRRPQRRPARGGHVRPRRPRGSRATSPERQAVPRSRPPPRAHRSSRGR